MKCCIDCLEIKLCEDFYRNRIYYYQSRCKLCSIKKTAEWGSANKERKKLTAKNSAKNNREKIAARGRKWRKNNPERVKLTANKWYSNNVEKCAAWSSKWQKNNREKNKLSSALWKKNNPERAREHVYQYEYGEYGDVVKALKILKQEIKQRN